MTEVCIIGFGFSAVPLVRELDQSGTDYQIISDKGDTAWSKLNEKGRLDFDLVSNYLSSFYTFDLAENYEKDYYPTAREFFEMHRRWQKAYEHKTLRETVIRVENYENHSEIFTSSGKIIKARHVVISTGFKRSIHSSLSDLDYNVTNKTIVLDTIGDSANLIMSNLIPRNNKIIIRTNGFHALDKVIPIEDTLFTLDQLEFHNFRYVSQDHYNSIIVGNNSGNPFLLSTQFPTTVRNRTQVTSKSFPPNGTIVIKYWPIDFYAKEFENNLEASIAKGYLLNDLAMWFHTGKVIAVPKETPIDFEKKTITIDGIERSFDQYVTGDAERPNLPEILINGSTPYEYSFRENFMGIVPKKLNNIYTLGYTRPMTGGVANITEMQCIFIHKMITQSAFRHKMRHNLEDRIDNYNKHYYGTTPPGKTDHSVYYGFYTDDVARLMGIDYKPSDCKTLKDLVFYYAFPNNALKYRARGEYAVEGVDKLVEKINGHYNDFIRIFGYILASSTKKAGEDRVAWLEQRKRYLFNDMRPKEGMKPFMEEYFKAYRKVKNIQVPIVPDEEWDQMVKTASANRDHVVKEGEKILSKVNWSEDIEKAADIVKSTALNKLWMASSKSIDELQKHFALLGSMKDPKEYDKPYLSVEALEKVE